MTAGTLVRLLLYSVLIFAPLARGGVQDWAVAVIQMLVLAAAGVYLVDSAWRWEWRWNRTALDGPLLAMFGLALVSTLFSAYPPASWRAMWLLATYLLFYGLAAQVFDSRRRRRELVWVVFGLTGFLTAIGFVKLFSPAWVPLWVYPDIWMDHSNRMSASFGNPNHFAAFLEMALLLMIAWIGACRTSGGKMTAWLFVAVGLVALVLTLSRGGWCGFAAGLVWMLALRLRRKASWKPVVLGVGFGCVLLMMILAGTPTTERAETMKAGTENMSLGMRMAAWKGVVEMVREAPVLGFGPGTFSMVFPQYQPAGLGARFYFAHNDWLEFAAELGIGFLILLAWLFGRLLLGGWRASLRHSRVRKAIGIGASAAVVALWVHGVADFSLQIPGNGFWLASVFILAVGAEGDKRRSGVGNELNDPRMLTV